MEFRSQSNSILNPPFETSLAARGRSRGPRAGVFGLQARSEERAPRFETKAAGAVFSSRPALPMPDKACGAPAALRLIRRWPPCARRVTAKRGRLRCRRLLPMNAHCLVFAASAGASSPPRIQPRLAVTRPSGLLPRAATTRAPGSQPDTRGSPDGLQASVPPSPVPRPFLRSPGSTGTASVEVL